MRPLLVGTAVCSLRMRPRAVLRGVRAARAGARRQLPGLPPSGAAHCQPRSARGCAVYVRLPAAYARRAACSTRGRSGGGPRAPWARGARWTWRARWSGCGAWRLRKVRGCQPVRTSLGTTLALERGLPLVLFATATPSPTPLYSGCVFALAPVCRAHGCKQHEHSHIIWGPSAQSEVPSPAPQSTQKPKFDPKWKRTTRGCTPTASRGFIWRSQPRSSWGEPLGGETPCTWSWSTWRERFSVYVALTNIPEGELLTGFAMIFENLGEMECSPLPHCSHPGPGS